MMVPSPSHISEQGFGSAKRSQTGSKVEYTRSHATEHMWHDRKDYGHVPKALICSLVQVE